MGIVRPGWFSLSVRNDKSQYRAHTWVRPYVGVDPRVYPLPTVEPWVDLGRLFALGNLDCGFHPIKQSPIMFFQSHLRIIQPCPTRHQKLIHRRPSRGPEITRTRYRICSCGPELTKRSRNPNRGPGFEIMKAVIRNRHANGETGRTQRSALKQTIPFWVAPAEPTS